MREGRQFIVSLELGVKPRSSQPVEPWLPGELVGQDVSRCTHFRVNKKTRGSQKLPGSTIAVVVTGSIGMPSLLRLRSATEAEPLAV